MHRRNHVIPFFFSGFWFHFILLGLIFVSFVYFYEIYPKMSGVLV